MSKLHITKIFNKRPCQVEACESLAKTNLSITSDGSNKQISFCASHARTFAYSILTNLKKDDLVRVCNNGAPTKHAGKKGRIVSCQSGWMYVFLEEKIVVPFQFNELKRVLS